MGSPEQASTVGPYRLVRRRGAGGMGVVYLGHDLRTGTAAAVKLIRPEHAADPDTRARLRREVAAARRVPRFCTAPVLDADLDGDPPWVATEYVDGPDLDTALLQQGTLAGGTLESLAVGLAVALRAIHDQGVIHRDLKPSNVLLSAWGPRVIDFGIARIENQPHLDPTQTGAVVGTPAFMTPEQLSGQPLTTAVDVFAWAALVTCAATGRRPFGTGNAALSAIRYGQPDLGDLPEPLRGLVEAAFAKDPAARPSAADLVDRLTGFAPATVSQVVATAAASPTAPLPPAPPPPPAPGLGPGPAPHPVGRRTSTRRTLLAAASAGAVVLTLLVAVTGAAIWLSGDGGLPLPGGDDPPLPGGGAFEGTLRIGGLMPATGTFADFGAGMIAAAEVAVEDINAAGGVWGNDVEWSFEDEGTGDPAGAAAAGGTLIAQGVHAVIGGLADATSLAVIDVMHDADVILVSPTSSTPELTDHPSGEHFFRTVASEALQANALAELALADEHATLAILADEIIYTEEFVPAIEQTYTAGGGQVVHQGRYERTRTDYTDEISALVDADPAAFMLVSAAPSDAETIVQALVAGGFTPQDAQWYFAGGGAVDHSPILDQGTLAGVTAIQPHDAREPEEFLVRVEEHAGGFPQSVSIAETYDAVMVVALAAVAAGSDDPEAIRDQMVGVTTGGAACADFAACARLLADGEDIDYDGHSGVEWNAQGEPAALQINVFEYGADNNLQQVGTVTGRP